MALNQEKIDTDNASCTLWLENAPQYQDCRTAALGDFAAKDKESGIYLIQKTINFLKKRNYEYLIGPMNGSTWNSYRFVTKSDNTPPFLMEPLNPSFYPEVFLHTGFTPIAEYSSARMNPSHFVGQKILPESIKIRSYNNNKAEDELYRIWLLSLQAFSDNFLYTHIDFENFMALYSPILEKINPDYVFMAEDEKQDLKGFLFAIPDYNEGQKPSQLIVKTYASIQRGIGGPLLDSVHIKARDDGFKSVLHALMHEENNSKKHSKKTSQTFRRYTLYGRGIGS